MDVFHFLYAKVIYLFFHNNCLYFIVLNFKNKFFHFLLEVQYLGLVDSELNREVKEDIFNTKK